MAKAHQVVHVVVARVAVVVVHIRDRFNQASLAEIPALRLISQHRSPEALPRGAVEENNAAWVGLPRVLNGSRDAYSALLACASSIPSITGRFSRRWASDLSIHLPRRGGAQAAVRTDLQVVRAPGITPGPRHPPRRKPRDGAPPRQRSSWRGSAHCRDGNPTGPGGWQLPAVRSPSQARRSKGVFL